MAEIEKTEFEFPDEASENPRKGGKVVEPEIEIEPEIEVVDDTPEKDRYRTPMNEAPQDPTEEELASYSESVKNRFKHFTKGYHEERRAKEAATREKDEALRIAQAVFEENKRLKGSVNQGQTYSWNKPSVSSTPRLKMLSVFSRKLTRQVTQISSWKHKKHLQTLKFVLIK